ncbi:hypothetical protein [Rhizobium leguminosarum]|uniref:hypothetical protein n=1 Tax=Rhizobium leguminosarum TaxID=384 RepID=UPI001C97F8CE|nr:hypothetical protein [Rhizobium leguminosarum]MBY5663901.1 hypothetical protein [Rhizobium leguminosarum]MBY5677424.1 hypothetical protein [Rhizobium leguminosarum]
MSLLTDDPKLWRLASHTVGFLKIVPISLEKRSFQECGSGVLAEVGGIKGVITAGHVIRELQAYERGAVFPSLRQPGAPKPFEFGLSDCQQIIIGGSDSSANGPDLGFIRLPYNVEQRLQDNWLFYNFSVRLKHAIENAEETPLDHELICGVVAEKTMLITETERSVSRTYVTALAYGGSFNGRPGPDGYDLFDFIIRHNEEVSRPSSYGGMSGSAIWKIGSTDAAVDRLICGIAFYETEPDERGNRTIVCHGPECIYGLLVDRIREAFPKEFQIPY